MKHYIQLSLAILIAIGCKSTQTGNIILSDDKPTALETIPDSLYSGNGPLNEADLASDTQKRRMVSWNILEQVLAPTKGQNTGFEAIGSPTPVWQTWYSKKDIVGMLEKIAPTMEATDKGLTLKEAKHILEGHKRSKSPDFDPASIKKFNFEFVPASYNRDYVLHILTHFKSISACQHITSYPADAEVEFPCFQFPETAVMMKTSWKEVNSQDMTLDFDSQSLDANAIRSILEKNTTWSYSIPSKLTPQNSYMVKDPDTGLVWALTGLHVVTKEIKDWVWVTLAWQADSLNTIGFGSDRPASLKGSIWQNYVMMASVSNEEKAQDPNIGAQGKALFPEFVENNPFNKFKDGSGNKVTFNSNPYIELFDSTSNCIGCHEGQFSPLKVNLEIRRKNFPYDYTYGTQHSNSVTHPRVSFRDAIDKAAAKFSQNN